MIISNEKLYLVDRRPTLLVISKGHEVESLLDGKH
jgi:hypothetical protein